MKIAVTGHTSGIGKSLFAECARRGHEVVGFSRSNGYDISDEESQLKLVNEISNFDLFINNAHEKFFQSEIFTRVWKSWRNQKKLILNIGSIVTSMRSGPDSPQHPLGRAHYASEKASLEMATNWAWCDIEAKCDVCIVRPGVVDTPRTQGDPLGLKKIDPDQMATYIMHSILDQSFVIREIIIGNIRKNNA
jgi:NAD(P)-dependent dehydrogenase (short-subunit alcohol dehydrogenase family)